MEYFVICCFKIGISRFDGEREEEEGLCCEVDA
ncbi:hypothetical protein Metal_1881 [Methylomicrobium album BG8]|uniref:Uncharacterized protein n=1 Tax=Methylomicrobium album BG8 TaxID=686340 RepID=H8GP61_METAL|nr:hypothetical protein Metal_1881 [Methylomicrobium album BG8]